MPQLLSPPRPNPNSLHIPQTKRAREPLDKGQDSPGSRHAHKRKTQDYDRRPRHKPREHRYDYQGTGKPVERAHGNTKPKLRGRSRKQTINDRFHAPNVARSSRLTVSLIGIFFKEFFLTLKTAPASCLGGDFQQGKVFISNSNTPRSVLRCKRCGKIETRNRKDGLYLGNTRSCIFARKTTFLQETYTPECLYK